MTAKKMCGYYARGARTQAMNQLKVQSDDSKIRMNIHNIIRQGIMNGKTDEEIKEEILKEEENKKYLDFVESWINDKRNKPKRLNRDEEER